MTDIARITEIIEPEVKSLGFEFVRVKLIGAEAGDGENALQIMAERPETGQLIIEECAALSRRISDRFDELEEQGEVLIDEAYRLEVSSPGIDRPLTRLTDFSDWVGHEAKLALTEPVDNDTGGNRKSLRGDIAGVDGGSVLFDDIKSGRVCVPYDLIDSAKLLLTDKLIAATRPIDISGAEDVVQEQED